ncbi:serine--tRNA ligase, partial [Patescibacteria group bacterium]|nr:serine--tRNA ligase [Patescibacteria group bacterium]
MLDIKYIRENVEQIKEAVKNKNLKIDLDRLLEVDKTRTNLQKELE